MKKYVITSVTILIVLAFSIIAFNMMKSKIDVHIVEAYVDSYVELPQEMLERDFHMNSSQDANDYSCYWIKLKLINNNLYDVCNWRLTSIKINKDIEYYFDHSTPESASSLITTGSQKELTYLVYVKNSDIPKEEIIKSFETAEIKATAKKAINYSHN